jgi:hypothetical protein
VRAAVMKTQTSARGGRFGGPGIGFACGAHTRRRPTARPTPRPLQSWADDVRPASVAAVWPHPTRPPHASLPHHRVRHTPRNPSRRRRRLTVSCVGLCRGLMARSTFRGAIPTDAANSSTPIARITFPSATWIDAPSSVKRGYRTTGFVSDDSDLIRRRKGRQARWTGIDHRASAFSQGRRHAGFYVVGELAVGENHQR